MSPRDARHSGRRRSRTLVVLLALVLVAGVAAGAAYWRWEDLRAWLDRDLARTDPAAVDPPPGLDLPEAVPPRPVAAPADDAASPRAARVRRALARGLRDDDLGRRVTAAVADLDDGDPVFRRGPGRFVPASTTKVLTAAAALEVLGSDHTFETRVVEGPRPDQVVLVGGGDPYLATEPEPRQDRPVAEQADLRTLARRTARALAEDGRDRVRLAYDASLFSGPGESPRWRADYVPEGVVTPISALWADQGRVDRYPGRAAEPAPVAARRFARELRRAGVRVRGPVRGAPGAGQGLAQGTEEGADRETGAAPDEVASVESATVGAITRRVLEVSDNEGAEVLAHHVALAVEGEGSFTTVGDAVTATLRGLGVPMRGTAVYDGSGLSRHNRLTVEALLSVLQLAGSEEHADLREVLTGLPVAGFTGSLAARFDTGAAAGPGLVRAKTGTLTGVHGLAGITTDRTGNLLAFVLVADRVAVEDTLDARERLDQLAAELAACGCSPS